MVNLHFKNMKYKYQWGEIHNKIIRGYKEKDWLAWNQDSVSAWNNMSSHPLLFQCVGLVQSWHLPTHCCFSVLVLYKADIFPPIVVSVCWSCTKLTSSHPLLFQCVGLVQSWHLPTHCCFSVLVLYKADIFPPTVVSVCWSCTKLTSSHWIVTHSCHHTAETLPTWR